MSSPVELDLLTTPLEQAKQQTRSAMGLFALASIEAAVQHLKTQERMSATDLTRFLAAVEKCMRAVMRADRELRDDVLGDLDRRARERDDALSDFDTIEGRRLQ
jgi:hypothetical protein